MFSTASSALHSSHFSSPVSNSLNLTKNSVSGDLFLASPFLHLSGRFILRRELPAALIILSRMGTTDTGENEN